MGTEVQPCSKQTPCVSEEAVYRPEEGVSAEPVCEAGAPEPEQAPAPKVPPKASFQTPSVFRNYNTNQGDKANAEPDPQEAAPSPKKDAAYDRLLGEAYEKVKAAPSKEKMERLTDELFARAGDDPKLFARLYTDLREGLEFYTSEGGFIVKDVGVRFLQEALKKMDDTLCVDGYDAKVGNDNKNICSGMATTPDFAYSCIWQRKGAGAYPQTLQGPCRLDFAEHKGHIMITKDDYRSSPPLKYGTKVECCFRAAKGPDVITSSSWTTKNPKTR